MTSQKPKFAVLGNLSANLAEEISIAVDALFVPGFRLSNCRFPRGRP
jgi:hypothetical protein